MTVTYTVYATIEAFDESKVNTAERDCWRTTEERILGIFDDSEETAQEFLDSLPERPNQTQILPATMTVADIIKDYLKQHGFDGLKGGHCACELADFMPCEGLGWEDDVSDCEPGYKVPCDCDEGCNFHIVKEKPGDKCG